mgnify:FL=1
MRPIPLTKGKFALKDQFEMRYIKHDELSKLSNDYVWCEEKQGVFETDDSLRGTGLTICKGCFQSVHNKKHEEVYETN